ncbi:hypothetical protein V6Z98_000562 [Aspergillus fumigatus]
MARTVRPRLVCGCCVLDSRHSHCLKTRLGTSRSIYLLAPCCTHSMPELTDLHCLRIIETLHGSEDSLDSEEKALVVKVGRLVESEGWFGPERDLIVLSFMRLLQAPAVGEEMVEAAWRQYMRMEYYACLGETS